MLFLSAALLIVMTALSHSAGGSDVGAKVEDILRRFPAGSPAEQASLCKEILELGPGAIQEICGRLRPPGEGEDSAAEYALNALAVGLAGRGAEKDRRLFVEALIRSLRLAGNGEIRAFLISQIQLAGKEESIKPLAGFLDDERLRDPAARALLTIGGKAAEKAFLKVLPLSSPAGKTVIVKSLGEMRSRKAVAAILPLARNDDETLRRTARRALADIGDPRAEAEISMARVAGSPYERAEAPSLYLLFARRLAESGRPEAGLRIARELMKAYALPQESGVSSAALDLLADILKERALPDLLAAAEHPDAKLRGQALRLAGTIPGPEATAQWVAKAASVPADVRAGVLAMLGLRGDRTALTFVLESLRDEDPDVRLAAIPAAARLGGLEAIPSIVPFFASGNEDEIHEAKEAFLLFPSEAVVPEAIRLIGEVPPPGQAALLEVLGDKGAEEHLELVFSLTESEDPAVRIAASRALGNIAAEGDIRRLAGVLFRAEDAEEDLAIQDSIAHVVRRSPDPEAGAGAFLSVMPEASGSGAAELLRLSHKIGGSRVLAAVVGRTLSPDEEVRGAAVHALSKWPDLSAAGALLDLMRTTDSRKYLLLALEGYARLVMASDDPPEKKLAMLREALILPKEEPDKKLVLRALSEIRTVDSFLEIAGFLDNPALKAEAAGALLAMASDEDPEDDWLSDPRVISLLRRAAAVREDPGEREAAEKTIEGRLSRGGFVKLFDGRSLAGWKGLVAGPVERAAMTEEELRNAQNKADEEMRAHWSTAGGVLVFDGRGENLCTDREYGDFELLVDWKIGPKGDSGIYLRGSPQVQIWDPADHPEGSGGLYNNLKNQSQPAVRADRPAGDWNTFRIIMIDDKVTVYLNEILIVDKVVMENFWERDKPISPRGQVELQAHGSPLSFRNIYIREIPREAGKRLSELSKGGEAEGPILLRDERIEEIGG